MEEESEWKDESEREARPDQNKNMITEHIFTLQSLRVHDAAEILCGREAEATAELHHQHTTIRHLHSARSSHKNSHYT